MRSSRWLEIAASAARPDAAAVAKEGTREPERGRVAPNKPEPRPPDAAAVAKRGTREPKHGRERRVERDAVVDRQSQIHAAVDRRMLIRATAAFGCAIALPAPLRAAAEPAPEVLEALRRGGAVVMLRHAFAPGTFDPPEFRLGECRTQRNLDEAGRAQARRIGAWFRERGLQPAAVRSSPWCRCLDTARLAFGEGVQTWPALGSPRMTEDRDAQVAQLRRALAELRPKGFEVWVTHQFTISALAGGSAASGEGLVLRAGAGRAPQVIGPLAPG